MFWNLFKGKNTKTITTQESGAIEITGRFGGNGEIKLNGQMVELPTIVPELDQSYSQNDLYTIASYVIQNSHHIDISDVCRIEDRTDKLTKKLKACLLPFCQAAKNYKPDVEYHDSFNERYQYDKESYKNTIIPKIDAEIHKIVEWDIEQDRKIYNDCISIEFDKSLLRIDTNGAILQLDKEDFCLDPGLRIRGLAIDRKASIDNAVVALAAEIINNSKWKDIVFISKSNSDKIALPTSWSRFSESIYTKYTGYRKRIFDQVTVSKTLTSRTNYTIKKDILVDKAFVLYGPDYMHGKTTSKKIKVPVEISISKDVFEYTVEHRQIPHGDSYVDEKKEALSYSTIAESPYYGDSYVAINKVKYTLPSKWAETWFTEINNEKNKIDQLQLKIEETNKVNANTEMMNSTIARCNNIVSNFMKKHL